MSKHIVTVFRRGPFPSYFPKFFFTFYLYHRRCFLNERICCFNNEVEDCMPFNCRCSGEIRWKLSKLSYSFNHSAYVPPLSLTKTEHTVRRWSLGICSKRRLFQAWSREVGFQDDIFKGNPLKETFVTPPTIHSIMLPFYDKSVISSHLQR